MPQKFDQGVDVFDMNINSVLEITWEDSQYKHSGSGFLISMDGYAITNTHVVTHENGRSCGQVSVRICGENTTAEVLKLGDNHHGDGNGVDLALIKLARVPSRAVTVRFERSENVRNGERVFVIGNSLGYGTCITSGIVSDRQRNVNGKMLLMTDCAVNGGNSGGSIYNEKGMVIGAIVSGITSAEGMNFAIPANTVMDFIRQNSNLRIG
jgi:serine protease Do